MLPILCDGGADFAAEKHLGFAVRTNRSASLSRRSINQLLDWKMLSVTKPYAEGDRITGAAAAFGHALLPPKGAGAIRPKSAAGGAG